MPLFPGKKSVKSETTEEKSSPTDKRFVTYNIKDVIDDTASSMTRQAQRHGKLDDTAFKMLTCQQSTYYNNTSLLS